MFKNVRSWAYGLISGVIGGASAAVSSGFGGMLLDPKYFNLGEGLGKTLKLMGISAAFGAISHAVAFLMKSPLPPPGDDTQMITKP
jgi:hypothetical protein